MADDVTDFLEHYGVKGMRWGVRKEESNKKQISRQDKRQATREARAQKYVIKAETLQTKINEINKEPASNWFNAQKTKIQTKNLSKERDSALRDAEAKRQGKLTRKQKAIVAGVVFVSAYATYKVANTGEFNRMAMKGKAFFEGQDSSSWKKAPKLASTDFDVSTIKFAVVDQINKDYGAPGTKVNCRRCTFAYEMRRRGYDVAATRTTTGSGQDRTGMYNALTPGAKLVRPGKVSIISRLVSESLKNTSGDISSFTRHLDVMKPDGKTLISASSGGLKPTDIFSALSTQPNGARGELGVSWKIGGGHSMAWEIVKGKPVIFDAQTRRVYENPETLLKLTGAMKEAGFTRLDNVPLNEDFLMRWVKNA